MNIYLSCVIAGMLGMLFHVFVVKYPALKKRANDANLTLSVKKYLTTDWLSLLGSFLSVVIVVYVLDEIAKVRPEIMGYIKGLFIFIGYTGSSLIQSWLGKADKIIQGIVDIKTNIADGKTTTE